MLWYSQASLWTIEAISDFCAFTMAFYSKPEYLEVLGRKTKESGSTVTDMALVWLWWVAWHKDEPDEAKWGTAILTPYYFHFHHQYSSTTWLGHLFDFRTPSRGTSMLNELQLSSDFA